MIEQLLEIMRKRKCVRRFKPDPVPDDYIEKVLEAGRLAPSGANAQPWEFLVVKDEKTRREIEAIFTAAREAAKMTDDFPSGDGTNVRTAQAMIVVCGDPRFNEAYPYDSHSHEIYIMSLANVIEHMHLAATALGLGSCWCTVRRSVDKKLKGLFNIAEPFDIHELVLLGFPEGEPKGT